MLTLVLIEEAGEPMVNMLEKIFRTAWLEEKSLKDWSRRLVPYVSESNPQKVDKLEPANYRAIPLLFIPGNFL